jgi:hypothetical protein
MTAATFLDENDNYNRYFCIGHVNSNIFVQWFRTSSSAFTSSLVSRNFCEYESTVYFRVHIRIWKKFSFVFRENGKSKKKILSHCLSLQLIIFFSFIGLPPGLSIRLYSIITIFTSKSFSWNLLMSCNQSIFRPICKVWI